MMLALLQVEQAGNGATGRVLLDILIILVAAKLAAELAERVSVPTVAAEIVAGVLIGPSVLGIVSAGDVLSTLAELGVILLLLEVGMHMDLRELRAVGSSALAVAVVGVAIPFASGIAIGSMFGLDRNQSLFVGAALTATSVGITARVFGELKKLATVEARTVLGAAVADDVIGLIILTVVTRIATGEGAVTVASIAGVIVAALGFLIVCTALGVLFAPKVFALIDRHAKSSATLFALALAFALGVAQLATLVKLAPIIGAFVAGLSLGRSPSAVRIQRELTPVGHLLIPVFFLQIGINVNAAELFRVNVLGLAAALTVVAIVGKAIAGWATRGPAGDRLTIGLGMIPRGEVGLIFASIGLVTGVLEQRHYAAILLMVLVTTMITPPLLSWRVRLLERRASILEPHIPSTPEPTGGWLVAAGERISLAGSPGPEHLLAIAMPTSLAISEGRAPDDELVSWLQTTAPTASVSWTSKTTSSFLRLLEFGTPKSWRFLETTGVLQAALPELASAMTRRRSDPMLLDPAGVDRFPTLDKVKSLRRGIVDHADEQSAVRALAFLDYPERLMLAALLVDCCGDDRIRAQAVLERLCLEPSDLEEVGMLTADQHLLLATALRPDGLTAESVLRLAVHLGDEQRAAALYVLAIAMSGLERWERSAVEELHNMLALTLSGQRHGTATAAILEERRRLVRELANGAADPLSQASLDRIESAPISYLLSTEPEVVVRHLALLTQIGRRGKFAAVIAGPDHAGRRSIDLAAQDAIGLLARSTGVLEELGLTIDEASIATWTDGAAVQTFIVQPVSTFFPNADEIERDLVAASERPLHSGPVPDAVIRFDNAGSPWHTLCEVRATDRPGLLHAVAAAFAAAGVDVHGARVSTADELVFDVFELTQSGAGKVGTAIQDKVSTLLRQGVSLGSPRKIRFSNTLGTKRKQSGSSAEITRS